MIFVSFLHPRPYIETDLKRIRLCVCLSNYNPMRGNTALFVFILVSMVCGFRELEKNKFSSS